MRKKILFVLHSASLGGSAASMLNLLSIYKEKGTEVDLFLMDHYGCWTEAASKYANLLPRDRMLESAITGRNNIHSPIQYFYRIAHICFYRLFGVQRAIRTLYKKSAKKLSGKYDCVVAYQESATSDYVRYIDAPHRVSWLHTDYDNFCKISPYYSSKDMYDHFDDIVCVTQASVDSIKRVLGYSSDRVHLIRNTLPQTRIKELSNNEIDEAEQKKKEFLFVSVGRLSPEKDFEIIPRVARKLVQKGSSQFDWYIIGEGATKEKIRQEIEACGVADNVHLLGAKMNPYPYIKSASCLVITSLYEAQPMVANEALILDVPVISTEFSSVREVIHDQENGMIVEHNEDNIADALARFMTDPDCRHSLCQGARDFIYSNALEIAAVDDLLLNK